MFDETKHILSYGSTDNANVKFTTVARMVHILPAHTLQDATRQLHRQWQSGPWRRPKTSKTLLQFVNVVQLRLIYSLLDVTTYLVIDRIKVGAIRWPQIWRNESGCQLLKKSHVQCRVPVVEVRCLVERLRNCMTRRASQTTAAATGACHGNSRHWSSAPDR